MKRAILFLIAFCGTQTAFAQPTLSWVHGIGSTDGSEVGNVYQADSGAVYLSGRFQGTVDFDLGPGVFNLTSAGNNDGFIAKYDTTGQFVWAFRFGGGDSDQCTNFIVDSLGNIYATGAFRNTVDFDPGPGTANLSATSGTSDIFVAKYTSSGAFIWAKKMASSNGSQGADIRLDQWNNVYVVGRFAGSVNFDPGATNFSLTAAGSTDVFFFKLTESGIFLWAKRIGGTDNDFSNKFCVTKGGQIYITGSFRGSADFDPGPGTQSLSSSGSNDIFLGKYDADGNYIWAFKAGSGDVDNGLHVEIAQDSNVVLFCTFSLNVDFDPGPLSQPISSYGITDVAVVKYSSSGDYMWAKRIGTPTYDWVEDAGISKNGAIYFTGYFDGTMDMDPNAGTYNLTSAGLSDSYLNKLDPDGNFVWAKRGGGVSYDRGYYLDVTPTNDVYYSGIFLQEATFDFSANDTINSIGSYDIFFARIGNCADTFSVTEAACDSFLFAGNALTTSGNYEHTFYTSLGCDSLVYLQLTIFQSELTDTTAFACSSFDWRGNTYTTSGNYDDTLISSIGCDSIVRLNLTIYSGSTTTETIASCNAYTWNGATYTSSGIYQDTLINSIGCDSVLVLDLTVNYASFSDSTATACDNFAWHGNTYTSSGIYYDSLLSSAGCDSVLQLNLTLNYSSISDSTATACDSFAWHGTTYITSGIYYDSLVSVTGCDSVLRLTLTIHSSASTFETVTTCGNYVWHGNNYSTSGIYMDTLNTLNGCDSIVQLDLTLNSPSSSTTSAVACNAYDWQGMTFTSSGNYSDTLTNQVGCDSIVNLNLVIYPSASSVETITSCDSYVWQNNLYTATGIYSDTLSTQNGCDSILTLDLTIETIDPTISMNGDTLSATATGVNYQWIDCATNEFILNATDQSFIPSIGGIYAVIVSANNCVDTSACMTSTVGIGEIDLDQIVLYPNPTNGVLTIQISGGSPRVEVEITNSLGQSVSKESFENSKEIHTKIEEEPGIYFVKITREQQVTVRPIVKN